jgi:hypothetical protein
MGGEHGEDDTKESSEGRTEQEKGRLVGEGTQWEGEWGRRQRRRFGRKDKREKEIHVGEGTKWEGSMGKMTRKKVQKEGQNGKRNTRRRRT